MRNDNIVFLDNNKKFLDDVFFPHIKEHGIDTTIHLGDLVDRRKYINIQTAKRLREDFIVPMNNLGVDYHQILGNHDIYYKNTTSVNAVQELCCPDMNSANFHVYDKATEVILDNNKFLFVPWICQENKDDTFEKINNTNAQICLGHLELRGFQMFRGNVSTHGEDANIFSQKFDLTCSGHYHHKSSSGGIHYLGSHGQFTWSDHGDRRGFHILDLQTRDLQFIENPYQMFQKVWYDDTKHRPAIDFSQFKDMYVKIIVVAKSNPYWFDMFCEHVDKAQPIGVQIVEDHLHRDAVTDDSITVTAESTLDTIISYVNNSSTHIDDVKRQHLLSVMTDLYHRAQSQVI